MHSAKSYVIGEVSGWTRPEIIWAVFTVVAITVISVCGGDTLVGIISSVTGVMNVICTGKGKSSAYIFGLVNSVLYAAIAYNAMLYGDAMLNALYYLPMQFVGFYAWNKNTNPKTAEVSKRRMTHFGRAILAAVIAVLTYVYGTFLRHIGDPMPYLDSFTTVASLITLVITIRRFTEQWFIWIIIDAASIYMWYCSYLSGNGSIAALLMWIMFLINGVIMLVRWNGELNRHKFAENE